MSAASPVSVIDPAAVPESMLHDLTQLFFEQGTIQVPSVKEVRNIVQDNAFALPVFCVKTGLYGLITREVVELFLAWAPPEFSLADMLEIGSGCGALSKALGCRGTDSFIQQDTSVALLYQTMGQAVVPYGAHVERLDANTAVQRYAPKIIVASWVTHKYNEARSGAGGSVYGIDEEALLASPSLRRYIVLGNEYTHDHKSIVRHTPKGWRLTKRKYDHLISRSARPEGNCLYIWSRE